MAHTKVIMFMLILLAIAVPNAQTLSPGQNTIAPASSTTTSSAPTPSTPTSSAPTPFLEGTILINAGEDDPTFDLTDPQDIQTAQQLLTNLGVASAPNWPQFGFRGYGLVNQGIASLPPLVYVYQGVIQLFNDGGSSFYYDSNGLESFLSQKANTSLSQSNANHVLAKRNAVSSPGLPTSGSELPYNPGPWNKPPAINNNNCYRYATNISGGSFARPGRAGGKQPPAPGNPGYNCANFTAAAQSDGLTTINCNTACPAGSFKVALVLNPNTDYHWYRQDNNGNWSHKPGATNATNVDNSGNPITDPRNADRGPYTTFCGCFCVNVKKVTIRRSILFDLLEGDNLEVDAHAGDN